MSAGITTADVSAGTTTKEAHYDHTSPLPPPLLPEPRARYDRRTRHRGRLRLHAEYLPVVCFVVLGITEFIIGLNWGMYAVAIPVVIPLATEIGADPYIAIGAVCSAGVWGSHICFYSDATVISSAGAGCDNYRHAITQMPYGFLGAGITAVAYLVVGHL